MNIPLFSKQMSISLDGKTIACATDFSWSITKDMIEISCLDSTGAKQQVPDLYGWTVSFSGLRMQTASIDSSVNTGYDELANSLITSDELYDVFILPDVAANSYLTGSGYLSSMSMEGGVGSPVTYSGEIAGSGALVDASTAA